MTDNAPARAVLDVWCELQCPDCHAVLDDLRALREVYGDALGIRLRHFPLDKHRHAHAAAQAAEEAAEQGCGWPYIEAVLARTGELSERGEPLLLDVAGELGLDTEEMGTALIDGRHILMVDADHAEGKAMGVTGTPTFAVGDRWIDAGKSREGVPERLREIIDAALQPEG